MKIWFLKDIEFQNQNTKFSFSPKNKQNPFLLMLYEARAELEKDFCLFFWRKRELTKENLTLFDYKIIQRPYK